ncbi:hypothetical protein Tco_0350918, partial [Tanacetum coccineum]
PPSLYIPPLVDRRDDIPKSEQPPHKRLCLSTLGSSEVRYGIRDTWVDPAEADHEIAPTTLGEVSTRVAELAELHEHDTHDLHALLEDLKGDRMRIPQLHETVWIVEEEAYASREAWAHSIGLSQVVHHEL